MSLNGPMYIKWNQNTEGPVMSQMNPIISWDALISQRIENRGTPLHLWRTPLSLGYLVGPKVFHAMDFIIHRL